MPLNLLRRGGVVRELPIGSTFGRPIRMGVSQQHLKRISFIARRPSPTSAIILSVPRSSLILGNLVREYATRGRPKGSTNSKKTTKPKKKTTKKPIRQKKELTEEQKEKKKARELRKLVSELKKTALKPPKKLPNTAWSLTIQNKMAEARETTQTPHEAFKKAGELARAISADERQDFEDKAKANKAANNAAYEAWVRSHTPLQISEANAARRRLAKIRKTQLSLLKDDRLVKRPVTSFMHYFMDRCAAAKLRDNEPIRDVTTRVADEWRNLSDAEKEKYKQLAKADLERYAREHVQTYGQPPARQRSSSSERKRL